MNITRATCCWLVLLVAPPVSGQAIEELPPNGIQLGQHEKQRWQVGLTVTATSETREIYGTVPVPTDWPEQSVRILNEDISEHVAQVTYKILENGVKQMHVAIPRLGIGETAKALVTFEVTKATILPPVNVTQFVIPKKLPREMRRFLGSSPYIEVRHRAIRNAAKQFGKGTETGWETVETIYDWVRENVEYRNGELKGALAALRDGDGDCEELTSLFVALCRVKRIPARTVWIPGHCYPEFYLHDVDGIGHWIPCQAAGSREFGGMEDFKPILQKGDNFRVPEKKKPQRYVAEYLVAKRATSQPQVSFTRKLLPNS